jgi:hypothetical protein
MMRNCCIMAEASVWGIEKILDIKSNDDHTML